MRISDWSSDVCSSDLGCRTSRGEQGTDGAKGSQDIRIGAIIDIPAIVAGQRDMLPAQWCDVARDFVGGADVHQRHFEIRSAVRSAGKECVSTCRSWWSPYPYKKKDQTENRRSTINTY